MIESPILPYETNALEPHISKETIEFHYGKHHLGYYKKLIAGVKGTECEDMPLDMLVGMAVGDVFNNAAQVWNHSFYWNCLSPNGGGEPTGKMMDFINEHFGSFAEFKEKFTKAALTNFGSGWTWLTITNEEAGAKTIAVESTSNANTPIRDADKKPLMVIDVWEHAYYIDRKNDRAKYVESFWNLVNWKFIEKHLD